MARRHYPMFVVLIVSSVLDLNSLASELKPVYVIPNSPPAPRKNVSVPLLPKIASSSGPSPSVESLSAESVRQESQATFNILPPLKFPGHHKTVPESANGNILQFNKRPHQQLTSAAPINGNVPIPAPTLLPVSPLAVAHDGAVQAHGTPKPPQFHGNANHPLIPKRNPMTNRTNNDARSLFPMSPAGVNAVNSFMNFVPLDYENGHAGDFFSSLHHKREAPHARRRSGRGPPMRRATNSSSSFKNIINSFHDKVSRILMGPRRRIPKPMGVNKNKNDLKLETMLEEPRRSFTERVDVKQQARSQDGPRPFSAALNTVAKLLQNQYVPVLSKRERVRKLSTDESERIDKRRHRKPRRKPPPHRRQHPRKRRPHHGPPRDAPPRHRGNSHFEDEDDIGAKDFFKTHKEHHHHLGLLENPHEEILIQHKPLDRPKNFLGFKDQPHFNDDFHIPAYKESGPPYKAFSNFRSNFKDFKPWRPNFDEFRSLRAEHEGVFHVPSAPEVETNDYKEHSVYRKKPVWHLHDSEEKTSNYPNHFGSFSKRPHHHDKYREQSAESYSYYDPGMHEETFKPMKPYHKLKHKKYRDWEDGPRKPRKFHKVYDYDHGYVGVNHFSHMDTKMKSGAARIPALVKEQDNDAKIPKIIINHHHNLPPAAAGSSFGAAFASPMMGFTPSMHFNEDYYSGAGASLPGGSNAGMKRDYKAASEYPEAFIVNDFGKPPPPHFGVPPPGFGMAAAAPVNHFGVGPGFQGPMGPRGPVPHGPPMAAPMAFQNFGHGMPNNWMTGKPPHMEQAHFGHPNGMQHHPGMSHSPTMPENFPKPFPGFSNPPQEHSPQSGPGFGDFGRPNNFGNNNNENNNHNNNGPFSNIQSNPTSPFNDGGPPNLNMFSSPGDNPNSPFGNSHSHSHESSGPSSSPFGQDSPLGPPTSFMSNHHSGERPLFGGSGGGDLSSEGLPHPDASPFPSTHDSGFIPPFTPVPSKEDIHPTLGPSSPGSRESFFNFNNPTSHERGRHHSNERPSSGFDLKVVKTFTAGFDLPPNPLSPIGQSHSNEQGPPPPPSKPKNLFNLGVPDREHYKNKRQRQRQNFRNNSPQQSRERDDNRKSQSKSSILSSPRNKVESNEHNYSTLPDSWAEFRPDPSHNKLPSLTYDSLEIGSRMYKIKSALTPKGIMKAIMNRFPRARFFEKNKQGNRAHAKFTPFDAVSKSDEERGMASPARKRRKSMKTPHSIQDIINSDSNNNREIVVALPEEDAALFNSNIILNQQGELSEAASGGNHEANHNDNHSENEQILPSSSTPTETVVKVVVAKKDALPRRRLFRQRMKPVAAVAVNRSNEGLPSNHNSSDQLHTGGGEQDMYDDVLLGMQSINVPLTAEIRMGEVADVKKKKK